MLVDSVMQYFAEMIKKGSVSMFCVNAKLIVIESCEIKLLQLVVSSSQHIVTSISWN